MFISFAEHAEHVARDWLRSCAVRTCISYQQWVDKYFDRKLSSVLSFEREFKTISHDRRYEHLGYNTFDSWWKATKVKRMWITEPVLFDCSGQELINANAQDNPPVRQRGEHAKLPTYPKNSLGKKQTNELTKRKPSSIKEYLSQ